MSRILLVEDDATIREAQAAYLRAAGHEVTEAVDGQAALELYDETAPHLVILDLSLPRLDGLDVCRSIRRRSLVPIVMVTARANEIDELLGLEIGADDYLRKPFNPRILVARVRALLRRTGTQPVVQGPFVVDPDTLVVLKHGLSVPMTTTQFNIFCCLISRPGVVMSRDQLLDAAHDHDPARGAVFDRTIDAHITAIRKRVEDDPAAPRFIQTVVRRGYRFAAS